MKPLGIDFLLLSMAAISGMAASVLLVAARFGIPVSTTQAVSTAIMGVGAARNHKTMHWHIVECIVWTWVMTFPATMLLAYGFFYLYRLLWGC